MPHTFDATLKDMLALDPIDLVPAFDLPRDEPAVVLNVDLSTISAATDVAIGFGIPLKEIVDFNFQSGPDSFVDARCLLYNVALHFRFKVPVRTILILLRPKADSKDIDGKLAYFAGQSGVEFSYEVVRMWQQPVAVFLKGGIRLLPLAMLCQLPPDRPIAEALHDVVMEIDRRLAQECEPAQAVRLMTAAFILTGLRVDREAIAPIFSGVRVMHESTAFDYYVEEGLKKGLEQGLTKGLEQGREQGLIQGQRRQLLSIGRKLLDEPNDATIAALQAINDADRLERMALAILTATSWQELLGTP
jgi:hypothetical protein